MSKLLSELKTNANGIIKEVMENRFSSKLVECGVLPGAFFSVINRAPFKGPIFIQIENNRIALRREEAAFILVE